jgi:hypothetical protein
MLTIKERKKMPKGFSESKVFINLAHFYETLMLKINEIPNFQAVGSLENFFIKEKFAKFLMDFLEYQDDLKQIGDNSISIALPIKIAKMADCREVELCMNEIASGSEFSIELYENTFDGKPMYKISENYDPEVSLLVIHIVHPEQYQPNIFSQLRLLIQEVKNRKERKKALEQALEVFLKVNPEYHKTFNKLEKCKQAIESLEATKEEFISQVDQLKSKVAQINKITRNDSIYLDNFGDTMIHYTSDKETKDKVSSDHYRGAPIFINDADLNAVFHRGIEARVQELGEEWAQQERERLQREAINGVDPIFRIPDIDFLEEEPVAADEALEQELLEEPDFGNPGPEVPEVEFRRRPVQFAINRFRVR